ncbi:esterase [Burkholderia sp. Bp9140]|uniref:esterase n=1 Tax=Burkholderia sp. Bp9140 TaxID=2184572 RepID=UPI000F56DAF3|nr:esterase [Burkholderia sp. Bp9140]RQR51285.1 esterase [Burkholderia sp. Bp9140]
MNDFATGSNLDLVVHRPERVTSLILLFHGVGSQPESLTPVGRILAGRFPDSLIVSICSPEPLGRGWQWFSTHDVTEANRPGRVATAMPNFLTAVRRWQTCAQVDAGNTTLIGFSQGAIMVLEASQLAGDAIAVRTVAIAGRFAVPPRTAHQMTPKIHLIHGDADHVMPVQLAVEAERNLRTLGVTVTLDLVPRMGHEIDARAIDNVIRRLEN